MSAGANKGRPGGAGLALRWSVTWGRGRLRSHHVIVATLVVWAALKGLRLPNRWAATHLLLNYSQGFIRRGLVGQSLSWLGRGTFFHYRALAMFSYAVLILCGAAIAGLVRAADQRQQPLAPAWAPFGFRPAWMLTAVYCSSMACVFLMHEVGYLDQVGLLLVLLALQVSRPICHPVVLGLLVAGAGATVVMVHEAQMMLGVPLVLLGAFCRAGEPRMRRPWLSRLAIVVAAGGVLVVLVLCCRHGTRAPESLRTLQDGLAAQADFPLRSDAFSAIDHAVYDNYRHDRAAFWRDRGKFQPFKTSLLLALPAWLFFTAYALSHVRRAARPLSDRILLGLVALLAATAPWGLNLVGWDVMRWAAQAVTSAFLVCLVVMAHLPAHAPRRPMPLALPVLVAVLGLTSNHPTFLFDGSQVRWYPFVEVWSAAADTGANFFTPPPN